MKEETHEKASSIKVYDVFINSRNGFHYFSCNSDRCGNFYYVKITNTIPDNGDGGEKTVTITSRIVSVQVTSLMKFRPQAFHP